MMVKHVTHRYQIVIHCDLISYRDICDIDIDIVNATQWTLVPQNVKMNQNCVEFLKFYIKS